MSFQTSYSQKPDSGFHGMIDTMETFDTVSRRVDETDGIKMGKGCVLVDPAVTPLQVKLPTVDTEIFQGFVRQEDVEPIDEETGEVVARNKTLAGVVTRGVMHVYCDDLTYTYGQKVYVVASGANAGNATNVSTSNIDTGAIFVSKEATDRAIININNPQK